MFQKHFVEFYSPGTFVSEASERAISEWDVDAAVELAHEIRERHGARPYAFRFVTRGRKDDELDSKVIKQSGLYYLGGTLLTLADVVARNDPNDEILIDNMRTNDITRVVDNRNSWRSTTPFKDGDVLLDVALRPRTEDAGAA